MPWIGTNGIETYYEDHGSGPPLVVLHGASADHQVWAEQLQPLTDDYRVLLYDLRGHGRTGGSELEHYTVDTYADDLAAFIDALDLDQPAVLGHSWGGMIGYVFMDTYPEDLSALITVGSATPKMFSRRERLFKVEISRLLTPLLQHDRLRDCIIWVQKKLFGEDAAGDMDERERIRDSHECESTDITESERRKLMRAVREYAKSTPTWVFPEIPVLMMYGENEPYLENHAAFIKNNLDTCETAEIPVAGHNAQVDNPEFINSEIRRFLTTHR